MLALVSARSGRIWLEGPWLGWSDALRAGQRAAETAADEPRRLPLPRRARRRALRRQGEVAAAPRAPVLPGEPQRQPRRDESARRARRGRRDDRDRQRG